MGDNELPDDPRTPAEPETLFELLGHLGEPLSDGVDEFTLTHEELGELRFPTGRVVVCDPFTWPTAAPAAAEAGSGDVVIVRRATAEASRIGMAFVRFSGAAPASWEDIGEYGVDAGTSCFADPRALDALRARLSGYYEQDGPLQGEEPLVDALEERNAIVYDVDGEQRLAAFAAGLGDGVYAASLGRDATGVPCVLMTSFDNIAAESRPV